MNNEQQTWILKPGHEILNGKDNDYEWTALVKPGEDVTTGFCSTISTTIWEKHFMPLNVSGLTRQVEESLTFLCQYAYDAGYTTGDDRTVTGKDVDLSVKATALKIVGLFLNQEKETK